LESEFNLQFHPEQCNIAIFMENLVDDANLLLDRKRKIDFICNMPNNEIAAMLDKELVRFIIFALLSNAVKYSDDVIEFQLHCDEQVVTFHVHDKGVGISKHDDPYIYEKFYRSKVIEHIRGIGIGLSIAKKAVELHNGTIHHVSSPNEGTTFIVRLPRVGMT